MCIRDSNKIVMFSPGRWNQRDMVCWYQHDMVCWYHWWIKKTVGELIINARVSWCTFIHRPQGSWKDRLEKSAPLSSRTGQKGELNKKWAVSRNSKDFDKRISGRDPTAWHHSINCINMLTRSQELPNILLLFSGPSSPVLLHQDFPLHCFYRFHLWLPRSDWSAGFACES